MHTFVQPPRWQPTVHNYSSQCSERETGGLPPISPLPKKPQLHKRNFSQIQGDNYQHYLNSKEEEKRPFSQESALKVQDSQQEIPHFGRNLEQSPKEQMENKVLAETLKNKFQLIQKLVDSIEIKDSPIKLRTEGSLNHQTYYSVNNKYRQETLMVGKPSQLVMQQILKNKDSSSPTKHLDSSSPRHERSRLSNSPLNSANQSPIQQQSPDHKIHKFNQHAYYGTTTTTPQPLTYNKSSTTKLQRVLSNNKIVQQISNGDTQQHGSNEATRLPSVQNPNGDVTDTALKLIEMYRAQNSASVQSSANGHQLTSERRQAGVQSTMKGQSSIKHQRNISEVVVRTKYGGAVGGGGISSHNATSFTQSHGVNSPSPMKMTYGGRSGASQLYNSSGASPPSVLIQHTRTTSNVNLPGLQAIEASNALRGGIVPPSVQKAWKLRPQ